MLTCILHVLTTMWPPRAASRRGSGTLCPWHPGGFSASDAMMSEAVPLTVNVPGGVGGVGGVGDADDVGAVSPVASPGMENLRAQVRRQLPMIQASKAFGDAKAQHVLFNKDGLRELQNPMREYKDQYVVNLWKVYNHHYLRDRSAGKIRNLLFYAVYV